MTVTNRTRPQIFGTGLIALDLVIGADPTTPVRAWTGGTCGNVLSILAVLGWEVFPIARMNGDPASQRIRADMKKWGVQLKFSNCKPTTNAPIIIQHILRTRDGLPKHRFSWACPHCGSWLPSFKPVPTKAVERIFERLEHPKAFFMDRLSRSALTLAKHAADAGAVVLFEPSAKSDEKQLAEAMKIAHIIKYSDDRFARIPGAMERGSATLIEVQTLGASGLRFRHRLGQGISSWQQLDAVQPVHLADTCGSGDWCTAGLISKIASNGQNGLAGARVDDLVEALRFGQRLAAWNVGFEGARGAMYAFALDDLKKQLENLDFHRSEVGPSPSGRKKTAPAAVACPSCPPISKQTRVHRLLGNTSA